MALVRRCRYVCFFYDDFPFLDVGLLLRGTVEPVTVRQVYALSILRGEAVPLSADEFDLAASIPSAGWAEAVDEEATRELARKGVLLSDENDPELEALRARHESLERMGWNLEAALYYFLSKWRGIDMRLLAGQDEASDLLPPTDEAVRAFVDHLGPAPTAFSSVATPLAVRELPLVERKGELYDVLLRRRTTRSFERSTPLTQRELAVVLRYVFGYHGYVPLFGQVTTLKRTSPSAGGFHPVEAYPLIVASRGSTLGSITTTGPSMRSSCWRPSESTRRGRRRPHSYPARPISATPTSCSCSRHASTGRSGSTGTIARPSPHS
jgi:hypothetical protein